MDSRRQSFRSSPHSSEGNSGHQEGGACQDTEDTPDERLSIAVLDRNARGICLEIEFMKAEPVDLDYERGMGNNLGHDNWKNGILTSHSWE